MGYQIELVDTTESTSPKAKRMIEVNSKAPILISGQIQIAAPPDKVWSILSDIDNWNTWLKMVSHSKLNGPLEPNTTFDWKAGGTRIHSRLHTVLPPQFIGWTGKAMNMLAIHNWKFVDNGKHTEVFVEESMEGWLARLFKSLLKKSLGKDMQLSLELLKETCEKK